MASETTPESGQVLRRAVAGDMDLVCELIAEYYVLDGHRYNDETVRGAVGPLLRGGSDASGEIWLILRNDEVNGYAVLTWGYAIESGGRDALLDEIYVRSRGEGQGGAALEGLFDAARAAGASRMFLETERPNAPARRFYARYGFAEDDSVWMSREI